MMTAEKIKLLVVDNSALDRAIITEMFPEFDCYEAQDGLDALNKIKGADFTFDIIIMDIFMPVMDGFSALLEFKRQGILDKIPVIIMTSDQNSIDDLNAIDFGISDVFHKPFATNLCRRRVLNVIEAHKYQQQFGKIL